MWEVGRFTLTKILYDYILSLCYISIYKLEYSINLIYNHMKFSFYVLSLVISINARTISPFDLKLESHLSLLFLLSVTPKLTGKEARSSPLMSLEWHFLLIGIAQAKEAFSKVRISYTLPTFLYLYPKQGKPSC